MAMHIHKGNGSRDRDPLLSHTFSLPIEYISIFRWCMLSAGTTLRRHSTGMNHDPLSIYPQLHARKEENARRSMIQ